MPVVLALGGIAWALSDSAVVGTWFAVVFAIALVVLVALAAVALRTLRLLLGWVRLRLPSSLRHGLSNLYRPGNQSAAVLAALGTGVMLILAVYLMQATLLRDLRETASPKLPNIFLVDVTSDEIAGVKDFFAHQPGMSQTLDLMPVVQGRFISLNGQKLEQLKEQHYPRRMLERAGLSWADAPPAGDKVTQGKWWTDGERGGAGCWRRRGPAAAPGRGFGGRAGGGRDGAGAEGCRDLSGRWAAPGRRR